MNAALLAVALGGMLMQPWGSHLHGASRVLLMGLPTCGKSHHARALTADAARCLFYDVAGDDYAAPGRLDVTVRELERFPGLLDDEFCRLRVVPEADDGPGYAAEVSRLVALLWDARDIVAVFDEVGDYRAEAERTLNRLFRRGRHQGIATLLVSQFATDFPKTCRRAASDVYAVGQKHPHELKALADVYGEDFAARVAAWRKYEPPVTWRISEV